VHRWVRYEAPVMVCVAIDDDGAERVVNVVIGEELEDIRLARNAEGQPLIYDEHMELLDPNDHTAQRAAREAEDREWPDPDEWEGGPDALRFPGLYDPVELEDDDEDEDLDPLDLDEAQAAQAS
jgi:hypothetical protein